MDETDGRVCNLCKQYKDSGSFYLNKYKKLRSECKQCAHQRAQELYERQIRNLDAESIASKMATRAIQRCNKINGYNPYYRRYDIKVEFDNHTSFKQYIFENFATDIVELLKDGKTPSLDRLDTQKGYAVGNLRVIDYALNTSLGRDTFAERNCKPLICTEPSGRKVAYKNVISASKETGISRKVIRNSFNNGVVTRKGYSFELIETEAE